MVGNEVHTHTVVDAWGGPSQSVLTLRSMAWGGPSQSVLTLLSMAWGGPSRPPHTAVDGMGEDLVVHAHTVVGRCSPPHTAVDGMGRT